MKPYIKAPPTWLQRPDACAAAVTRSLALAVLLLALASAPTVVAQTYTDAVSREVSLFNAHDMFTDAITRELSVFNDSNAHYDAVSREISAFNGITFLEINSSGDAQAYPVPGTLQQQLTAIDVGPPAYDPNTWLPVHRKNINTRDQFRCGEVPDPLARAYVDADEFLLDADEVTWNNCDSAFYRFTFDLANRAAHPVLSGVANADDQGVAFLNGQAISGLMTVPACEPTGGPSDPCYLLQDAGHNRTDAAGRGILTWPTLDPFASPEGTPLLAGENVLVFGVCGNAAYYKPTGVEFQAAIIFHWRGDLNCDGAVNFDDINPFVQALSDPVGYAVDHPYCDIATGDCNGDGVVTFDDINPFIAILSGG
jgi:hypothetical protein